MLISPRGIGGIGSYHELGGGQGAGVDPDFGLLLSFSCSPAKQAGDSFSLPPLPVGTIMCIHDFIAYLARACKSHLEIREMMESVYG